MRSCIQLITTKPVEHHRRIQRLLPDYSNEQRTDQSIARTTQLNEMAMKRCNHCISAMQLHAALLQQLDRMLNMVILVLGLNKMVYTVPHRANSIALTVLSQLLKRMVYTVILHPHRVYHTVEQPHNKTSPHTAWQPPNRTVSALILSTALQVATSALHTALQQAIRILRTVLQQAIRILPTVLQ